MTFSSKSVDLQLPHGRRFSVRFAYHSGRVALMTTKLTIQGDVCADMAMTNERGYYVREYEPARHLRLVQAEAKKHGVKAVMIEEEGPAGGNPLYEFTGTRAQLEAFVTDFYEAGKADAETIEFYFEDAQPAPEDA